MRNVPQRRWSRRGRLAVLAIVGASALIGGTTVVRAVAGEGSQEPDDDVGYVGGPSYLDPDAAPYFVPAGVETFNVPPVELVSRRSDVPGDLAGGTEPSVSADGRYVAFTTPVPDSEGRTTVMLRDRATGELAEATPELPEFPNRSSRHPVLSADGCVIAVATTTPYDVFRDDDNGQRWDVYRQVLPQCADNPDEGGGDWELMSSDTSADGTALNSVDPDQPISLSAGGTVVAFSSVSPTRFAGPDPVHLVAVADATVPLGGPGRITNVPGLPREPVSGAYRVIGQTEPALSSDGRFVAFTADARADRVPATWTAPAPGSQTAVGQVFVWDRFTTTPPVLVSATLDGTPVANGARQPAVSDDGRFVAYVAAARLGVGGGIDATCENCPANVFVADRDTDGNGELDEPGATAVTPASVVDGVLGDGDSSFPVFGLNGRLVGFVTRARNLVPGAVGSAGAFVTADLTSGITTVATTEAATQRPAAVVAGRAAMGSSGRTVVIETTAPSVLGASVVGSATTQIVALTATPAVRIDDIDVGTSMINVQTARSTTITNAGPGAFVPAAIASTSPAFVVAGGTCQVGAPVAAGDSCTIDLLFNATTLGFTSTQLVVSEAGVGAVTVAATVSGSGGEPRVEADPPTAVFAEALAGTDGETVAIKIRSVGDAPSAIAAVSVGGTHPGDFLITDDGCTGRTVPPTGACVVRVTFHPLGAGGRSAVLLATTTEGAVTRSVLGGSGFYQPTIITAPGTIEAGGKVRVAGTGFPADIDITVAWESGRPVRAHTDVNGAFDISIDSLAVIPGTRRIVVSDSVIAGTTPRFPALASTPIRVSEANSGQDASSPVFD